MHSCRKWTKTAAYPVQELFSKSSTLDKNNFNYHLYWKSIQLQDFDRMKDYDPRQWKNYIRIAFRKIANLNFTEAGEHIAFNIKGTVHYTGDLSQTDGPSVTIQVWAVNEGNQLERLVDTVYINQNRWVCFTNKEGSNFFVTLTEIWDMIQIENEIEKESGN